MFYKNDVTRGITHGYQIAWTDYLDFMLMKLILIQEEMNFKLIDSPVPVQRKNFNFKFNLYKAS